MLKGLQHIHAHGVIHCDIKPANIMMKNETTPVIVDFDIALTNQGRATTAILSHTRMSHKHGARGTVGYIAPELLQPGVAVRPTIFCDVFSFGATLVWMMFGTDVLLNAKTVEDVRTKVSQFKLLCAGVGDEDANHTALNASFVSFVLKLTRESSTSRPNAMEALCDAFVGVGLLQTNGVDVSMMDITTSSSSTSSSSSSDCPFYWQIVFGKFSTPQRVDVTTTYKEWVSAFMNKTMIVENNGKGRDCAEPEQFTEFEVVQVERVENASLFSEFASRRSAISQELKGACLKMEKPPLTHRIVSGDGDGSLEEYAHAGTLQQHEAGEYLLFHGVRDRSTISKIVRTGNAVADFLV